MAEQSSSDRDEMARRLRANLRGRGRQSLPSLLITLLLVGVPLGLLAWWLWPRPELPRLVLITFDQVALPGESVPLRARLVPQDANHPAPDLRGLELSFEEAARQVNARSERSGEVEAPWQAPADREVMDFKVSYADPRQQYRTEDRARLWAWKADTPLLLVEVASLADAGPDAWRTGRIRDIPVPGPATNALKAARKKNYQVVYVAGGGAPMVARKMRGWVEQSERLLPDGPVLGQLSDGGERAAAVPWADALARLKQRFRGPAAGVATDPRLAQALHEAGVTTFVLGMADAPQGVTRLTSWGDLAAQLLK
jgi:hypothetical protein